MILTSDTVWHSGQVVNLTENVQIAAGARLTIESGAVVLGGGYDIQTFGELDIAGSDSLHVSLNNVRLTFGSNYNTPGRIDIAFADFFSGAIFPESIYARFGSFRIVDSYFDHVGAIHTGNLTSPSSFERNLFIDTGLDISQYVSVLNNIFQGSGGAAAIVNRSSSLEVHFNAFIGSGYAIETGMGDRVNAQNNWYGTTDRLIISNKIQSSEDDSRFGPVNYLPILQDPASVTAPSSRWLLGTAGSDYLSGNSSDNMLIGLEGDDVMDGGDGIDTVVYSQLLNYPPVPNFYTISQTTTGYTVTNRSGEGTDTLINIENIRFWDGTFALSSIDDVAGDAGTTRVIEVGRLSFAQLEQFNDHDWFRVTLTAGEHYQIEQRGSPSGGGTLLDPSVGLRDATGKLLVSNDNGGLGADARILFYTAPVTGTYYIDAGASSPTGTGSYSLSVTTTAHQFATQTVAMFDFGQTSGWSSNNSYPRALGDVNGDGIDDIVGFGQGGVFVSLAMGLGWFTAAPWLAIADFGQSTGWTSNDAFHRELADVNGDGRADIVGFGQSGVLVSLATGNGYFAAPQLSIADFGPSTGWTSDNVFHREMGDVNGDGRADIVGFGNAGVYVSLSVGGTGFASPVLVLDNFAPGAGGWGRPRISSRALSAM